MNGKHLCAGRSNQYGNTLVLTVCTFVIVLLLLGLLITNFSQLLGVHKEATSAVDSAALAVAKDMSKAVVNTPLGRIGMVDDISAKQSLASTNNSTSQSAFKNDPRPVYSINTWRAILRLDSLIATNPKVNNKTMLWLIKQDLAFADNAASLLRQQILSKVVYDKFGNKVDFQKDAYDAYTSFNVERLSVQTQTISPDDLTLEFGAFTGTNNSNCPTPLPKGQGIDPPTETQPNYLSYTNYTIPGLGTNVRFLPGATQVGLVAAAAYGTLGASDIPVVAKVSVSQKVGQMAPSPKQRTASDNKSAPLQVVGYAQAAVGNIGAQSAATGTLVVTFPAGFPTGNFHDPSSGSFPDLSFKTIAGIMNASQLDPTSSSPASSYSRWHKPSKGNWATTVNGPVPWTNSNTSGSYAPQNFLGPSSTTGQNGLADTDPSVTMALLVTDWLKTAGLRPSVTAVVNALTFDYQNKYGSNVNQSPTVISSNHSHDLFLPPAYAQDEAVAGQTTPILNVANDGVNDPRNLERWNKNPSAYNRQQSRMWGYVPADSTLAPDAKIAWLNAQGEVTTIDGNPVSDLNDLLNKIAEMDSYGMQTFTNAIETVKKLTGGKASQDTIQKCYDEHPRLVNALQNASYCTEVAIQLKTNLRALTSMGTKKISDRHFVVAGSDFFPPSRAATQEELLSESPAQTGQDRLVKNRDWCAPPVIENGVPTPSVVFYKRTSEPVIGNNHPEKNFLPPALAATAQQSNFYQFIFRVVGGSTHLGTGTVQISPQSVSPYGVVPCLKGQAHYQDVTALVMEAANDPKALTDWQVQARDQTVNAYAQNNNAQAAPQPNNNVQYFTDFSSGTYNTQWCQDSEGQPCPIVAAEWSLSCPIVEPPPPPPPPCCPPAPPPPPPPNCDSQLLGILMNNVTYRTFINNGAKLVRTGQVADMSTANWVFPTTKYTYQLINNGIVWGNFTVYRADNPLIDTGTAGRIGTEVSKVEWLTQPATVPGALGRYYPSCDPFPYEAHI
jgi:hypothetical protein